MPRWIRCHGLSTSHHHSIWSRQPSVQPVVVWTRHWTPPTFQRQTERQHLWRVCAKQKNPHNMLGRANFIWRITCAHGFFGGSYKATNPRTHFDQSFGLAMLTSIASHLLRAHNRVHTLRSSRSNPDRWRHLFHGIRRCNFFLVHDHRRQTFSSAVTAGLAMDCRVGLRWHFRCGCPISKPRPVLDFSSKNRGSFFLIFSKSRKMSSCGQKWCFWRFQQKFDGSPIIVIQ